MSEYDPFSMIDADNGGKVVNGIDHMLFQNQV